MKNISIFGTSSDAGKSTITFVIAKILQDLGVKVAPFKAQNVSNNAYVCDDGSEIAVAQYFQALVLGVPTSYHLNPVLLKSGRGSSASVIVEGQVLASKDVLSYYKDLDLLKPAVDRCFSYLNERYDCLVCEGAGSPVELNLMDKDLSNIYIATKYNTKIILVADIEKGGVFASIYGVYNLLPKELQKNVIGVIVNKFRGDLSLFDEGIRIIENDFKIPVLGVLPYVAFNLGFEDSQSLKNYAQNSKDSIIRVGVISYPYMSNYNDFEPLIAHSNINLEFIENNISLDKFDMIILPGSKLVIKDLQWLKSNGLFERVKEYKKTILGLCGGYEMMFNSLEDKYALENSEACVEEGFAFIDDEIIFEKEKILKKASYKIFDCEIEGFEIHHGVSTKYPISYETDNIKGTFIHAIFDNDNIRTKLFKAINSDYKEFDFKVYKKDTIDSFISNMRNRLDVNKILENINE
ncbi:cobyric acid synthase CobQ [Arcobacter nitrofigilis DSM 7299]|uniref:Cobyric acid synthase n=1 Tax=Arcobacter nitrofigilis (strain ATCC 33309 / DSM 7299 / CCUG 15893 / LMG 7604 / NCTC 12251 / CI) TaxID=572480 RepID=D5V1Q7_ARCNC|nr:cobyric acid synthase [Arcobacter nitrofigilis]ADG93491.1 cobyric acid synthase CobQ [Arcobacter nitrofigilis DSM 7299]